MNITSAVAFTTKGSVLSAKICGEIDHHSVRSVRKELDAAIYTNRPKEVVIDLDDICFMDSSGLGLIVGRVVSAREVGATLALVNVPTRVFRIFEMAGLSRTEGLTINIKKGDLL